MENSHDSGDNPANVYARKGSFLDRWLRRDRGTSQENTGNFEQDNDEESEDEPGKLRFKKFRRAFRRPFSRLVTTLPLFAEKEKNPLEQADKPGSPPLPENLLSSPIAETQRNTGSHPDLTSEKSESSAPAESSLNDERQTTRNDENRERSFNISHESNEHSFEQTPQFSTEEQASPPDVPPPLAREIYERAATEDIKKPERVVERERPNRLAAAVGVGLVAENILRRRADRNIRKENESGANAIKKEVKLNNSEFERAERKNAQTRQTTQDLLVWQRAFESRQPENVPTSSTRKTNEVTPVEKRKPSAKPNRPEKVPEPKRSIKTEAANGQPKAETPSTISAESMLRPREALSRQAAILEKQIEAAAEQNAPLEAIYERSHETKDDPAATAKSVGAVSTKSSQRSGRTVPIAASAAGNSPDHTPESPNTHGASHPTSARQSYRQAAQSGFWAAIILLAILAVIAVF